MGAAQGRMRGPFLGIASLPGALESQELTLSHARGCVARSEGAVTRPQTCGRPCRGNRLAQVRSPLGFSSHPFCNRLPLLQAKRSRPFDFNVNGRVRHLPFHKPSEPTHLGRERDAFRWASERQSLRGGQRIQPGRRPRSQLDDVPARARRAFGLLPGIPSPPGRSRALPKKTSKLSRSI